jgi:DNA-binding NarL/FixJ family response regulator
MIALIVDDHPLLRQAIRQVIEHHFPSIIARESSTAEEAEQIARTERVDLAVLDIVLPDYSGLRLLKQIKRLRPQTVCLMLSIHDDPQYVRLALSYGASGYLTKESAPDELRDAIRMILSGGRYLTQGLEDVVERPTRSRQPRAVQIPLSARELEVLSLLGKGRTVSQVAERLKLSVKTVSTYRARLLEKLGLETTAEIIRYAIDHHLVR